MEDDRENRRKRKLVDIPEASASASSVPVINPKKRKVEESTVSTNSPHDAAPAENTDLKENIKKLVEAIKNYVQSSSELDKAVGAIRELEAILSGNNAKKRAKIMVKKKAVTRLINLLIKSSISETLTVDVEIMDASALGLLTCLAKHRKRARRTIIDERTIHYLLLLISRQHILADDEFSFRVQLAGLKLFRVLLQSSAEETARALLALLDNGGAFVSGLCSVYRRVQLMALLVIRILISTNGVYGQRIGENPRLVSQLTVLLSSKSLRIQRGAACVILSFLKMRDSRRTRELFVSEGIIFPAVDMLHSGDSLCRRLGADLAHYFAALSPNTRSMFASAGALSPLVEMLKSSDERKYALSALHPLALKEPSEHTCEESIICGIIRQGALELVTDLFFSPDVQHDPDLPPLVARVFKDLVDNPIGAARFIEMGGIRLLRTARLHDDFSRTVVAQSCWRELLFKLHHRSTYTTRLCLKIRESSAGDFLVRARYAHAFALFADPKEFGLIFIHNKFFDILLQLYASDDPDNQYDGAEALYNIAARSVERLYRLGQLGHSDDIDEAFLLARDFLGQAQSLPAVQFPDIGLAHLKNPNYDITFLLDNNTKQFQAHKCVLTQASEVFRAMFFENSFKESAEGFVEVRNIKHSTFVSVMQFIYTGRLQYCHVDDVYAILEAADFYGLHSLTSVCEYSIAREHIVVEKVASVYEFAEKYNCKLLMHVCILFILEYHEQVRLLPWYRDLVERIIPEIRLWLPATVHGPLAGSLTPRRAT